METLNSEYWQDRYESDRLGWDIGHCSRPLREYFEQLEDITLKVLIPGCGNAYEAKYLHHAGFTDVHIADWAKAPLGTFRQDVPDFPSDHLLHQDFFSLVGQYDLIVEQTFLCALPPQLRRDYAEKTSDLLNPGGHLIGLLFDAPMNADRPPFGGTKKEYEELFKPYFEIKVLEGCYNSEKPRAGTELFLSLNKKS